MRHAVQTVLVFCGFFIVVFLVASFAGKTDPLISPNKPQTDSINGCDCPSAMAARAYMVDQKVLKTVHEANFSEPGPVFMRVTGVDEAGQEKVVWLKGRDQIQVHAIAYLKDGISRADMRAKLPEHGIDPEKVVEFNVDLFRGYPENVSWLIRERLDNGQYRSEWFDFKTGERITVRY
jgi:uncharacterized protein YpmB